MKNQNNEIIHLGDFNAVLIGLIIGMAIVGFAYKTNEYLYAQSDVSALMKFNASEFGYDVCEPFKEKNGLGFACTKNNAKDSIPSQIYSYIHYFPQFANISLVVEPERQECWNESYGFVKAFWGQDEVLTKMRLNTFSDIKNQMNSIIVPFGIDVSDKEVSIKVLEIWNETKCQTIPAVTKQINPWAENENDLAAEFCRAESYQSGIIDKVLFWSDVQNGTQFDAQQFLIGSCKLVERFGNDDLRYGILRCNDYTIKPFTRGEVVEVDKFIPDFLINKNGKFGGMAKQKVIRCTGDDGTTKDFGDLDA